MSEKILILTEKREAGFQLAATLEDKIFGSDSKPLDAISKSKGYLEGDGYLICWAAGHLFTQVKASEIDKNYALFNKFETKEDYKMPKLLNQIKIEIAPQENKKRQIKILETLFSRRDIREIIVMTDADAEGEAIGRDMLYNISELPTKNITRAFNAGSFKAKEAVEKALNQREKINTPKYNRLYDVQQVRSKGDYLVGMKLTKALCDTYNSKLYTGRVKGVVTALIGNREEEIKNFKPKDFYSLIGKKGEIEFKHFYYKETENDDGKIEKQKEERYSDAEEVDRILKKLEEFNLKGVVSEYTSETISTKNRPLPLSGTDFASEMMGKYKIKYKECNEILDYLRADGFTTYPGTNGRFFSKSDANDVQVAFVAATKYFNTNEATYSEDVPIFDDKKAAKQNHTPLSVTGKIPTVKDIENWNAHSLPKIKEAYELIAKRILVHFLPSDEITKQSLTIDIDSFLFFVTGQKAITQGWRTFLDNEIKNTLFENEFKKNDEITLDSVVKKSGQTKCPILFTEKTLTDIMLNISKVVDDMIKEEIDPQKIKELKRDRKLLKDCEGIGTDRTREQIISDLIENDLLINTKDGLMLTLSGKVLYDVLPTKIKNPIMTANWETAFEDIRKGDAVAGDVLNNIDNILMNELVAEIVQNPIEKHINKKTENKTIDNLKCPFCGGDMIETPKTYKCENNIYKDGKQSGCSMSIFKDQTKFFGRNLTSADLPNLFAATKENPLVENKNGIYIDKTSPWLVCAIFGKNAANPDEIIETPKTFKLNDKFLYKNCFFKDLTKREAESLFEGKEVILKRKTKDGKDYTVKVKLDENKAGGVIKI